MSDTFRSIWKLKPFLRPYLGLIVISGLLAIPMSALRASPVAMVQYFVDDLLQSKDRSKLILFPALVLGVFLVGFVVRFFHYYCIRVVVAGVNYRVKASLFHHLLNLSSDYFSDRSTGEYISRVGTDPHQIDAGVSTINALIREPITIFILLTYSLYTNWKLALMTLAIFPPLALLFRVTARLFKTYMRRFQEQNARVFSDVQESLLGIRTVKNFRLERYVEKKFKRNLAQHFQTFLKMGRLQEATPPMVELITAVAIAGLFYYGGDQVLTGVMTQGQLLGFFASFALMIDPIRKLNDANSNISQAAAAADRVNDLLSWKSRLVEAERPKRVSDFYRSIRFNNVSFAYPDSLEKKVLDNVSFEISKNQSVALVGQSGSGKSSLVGLLPRMYDVTGGSIEIDGQDIREFKIADLRDLISVVSQDVFLFNDSVAENIRCGRLSASDEEIAEAAKLANASDFIARLPMGMKTVIGERGMKLSGGERQRISIARAFLRKAPLLILDEATSNLDNASERAVQGALETLMLKRTCLVIAHRLSTIKNCDHIVVMREGRVVEAGQHQELMKMNGEYAHFQKLGVVDLAH